VQLPGDLVRRDGTSVTQRNARTHREIAVTLLFLRFVVKMGWKMFDAETQWADPWAFAINMSKPRL
jgi:hypothetical protein